MQVNQQRFFCEVAMFPKWSVQMKKKPWLFNAALVFFYVLFTQDSFAQKYTRWGLPEGSLARLGKGRIGQILYSPDGTLLAVNSGVGVWLYDAETGSEIALLAEAHTDPISPPPDDIPRLVNGYYREFLNSLSFSPDGFTLARVSEIGNIQLWDVVSGKLKTTLADHEWRNPFRVPFSGWVHPGK